MGVNFGFYMGNKSYTYSFFLCGHPTYTYNVHVIRDLNSVEYFISAIYFFKRNGLLIHGIG